MAKSVKSKFAGLLRGLLERFEGDEAPPQPVAAPVAPPVSAPVKPTPPAPKKISASSANIIELPLAPIVSGLPMDLRAKLMMTPGAEATISLATNLVVEQLAFGAVKISFGELRQLAPGIFVNTGGELDQRQVSLPLGEILARLNPDALARRHVKKIEVTEEIAGPFGGRGSGVIFTTQPLKAPVAAPAAPPVVPSPAPMPRPIAPPRSMPPASNVNINAQARPVSIPISPVNSGQGNPPPLLSMKISAAPVPASAAPVPPTIFASLTDLSERWPEELKQEILASPLADVSVPLAGTIIEPGLKRGRVAMTWKQLRTLAQPSSPASVNDPLELELPLKVIAPLYLAAKKNPAKAQAKTSVSSDIPDLFFGFPQVAAPVATPLPKPPEPKNADTNFYVWGEKGEAPQADEAALRHGETPQTDFMSRQAHPKDVVARAALLPGVAGAVVAMADGLRVASQVPPDLNADTLAAFLPQIFERVNQSTRELRMGALNNVSFTVGNVPWKIFRVNSVYFAAFGRAGEGLPAVQLAALAGEIDRKKQS